MDSLKINEILKSLDKSDMDKLYAGIDDDRFEFVRLDNQYFIGVNTPSNGTFKSIYAHGVWTYGVIQ